MSAWKLKRTAQCIKCPWIVGVDPHEIPDGYSVEKHASLACTIAEPGDLRGLSGGGPRVAMACHEVHDAHCVGWLANQVGTGNNLSLRLSLMQCTNADQLKLRGEQHPCFEATLPP